MKSSTGWARSSSAAHARFNDELQQIVAGDHVAGAEVVGRVHPHLNASPPRIGLGGSEARRRGCQNSDSPAAGAAGGCQFPNSRLVNAMARSPSFI